MNDGNAINSKKIKNVSVVDEKLPLGRNIVFAFQHLIAMVAGAAAVPIIVGKAAGLEGHDIAFLVSCTLFAGGVATLLQTLGIGNFLGARIPVIEATSFAAVATLTSIVRSYSTTDPTLGIRIVEGSVFAAGLFCFLMASVWGKLLRFFPKVVTGTVVTVIGLSLFPIGINWIVVDKKLGYPSVKEMGVAFVILIITLILFKVLKGIWSSCAILLGLIIGTVLATMVGMANYDGVRTASWVRVVSPFKFGLPVFDIGAIIAVLLIMLVIMTEATGNFLAVSGMVGKDLDDKALTKGLRSSGLSTMISSVFNSYPVTPFGQNIGLVSLTGIKSRYVTATTGIILVILAFLPKVASLVTAIPGPVLGGVSFAMFGMVAIGGIRTLGTVNYEGNKNNIIVAVSIGLSLIPTVNGKFFSALPVDAANFLHSGITIGCISAILLNIFFNELGKPKNKEEKK